MDQAHAGDGGGVDRSSLNGQRTLNDYRPSCTQQHLTGRPSETERDEAFLSFVADAYVYWSAATFGLASAEVRGNGRHFCRENLASMVVSAGQQVRL